MTWGRQVKDLSAFSPHSERSKKEGKDHLELKSRVPVLSTFFTMNVLSRV